MLPLQRTSESVIRPLAGSHELLPILLVFLTYLLGAKLGQYISFIGQSHPALVWAPAGIAVTAVLLGGRRMWLPIALAQLAAAATAYSLAPLPIIAAGVIGYTLEAIFGAYLLRRLGYKGTLGTVRGALSLIGVSLFVSMLAPSLVAAAHAFPFTMPLPPDLWIAWSRAWAGGALSILVITPLVTSWYLGKGLPALTRRHLIEILIIFGILAGCLYVIFWTTFASLLGLPLVYILWATFLWIAIRLTPRAMSVAVALCAVIAISGGVIANPSNNLLDTQLFGDELIIVLFAPLYLVLTSVVEERRAGARELAHRVEELDRVTKKLSADDRAKNEFIAILAHELRNPLAPVVSALELLKLEDQKDESLRMIENAQTQTRAMRRLLDDLLDVSRISQNKFKLLKEPTDLSAVIARSSESVRASVRDRRHTLAVSVPEASIWLDADPVRLEQIIVNLLNNAVKYTDPGGRIELSVVLEEGQVTLSVQDTGIGISPEDLKHVFLPFRQMRPATSASTGLGIGLSLTKRLVEMHGGTIEAASGGAHEGSTFTVRLPVPAATQLPLLTKKARDAQTGKAPSEPVAFRILVVDDNVAAAEGLGKLLAHGGHTIALAHTGARAVQSAEEFRPDVVLLDIGLPDIDGYETARRLREIDHAPRTIIALTGYGQEEDKQKARKAGFDHHLTKPVGIADVNQVLRGVARTHSSSS